MSEATSEAPAVANEDGKEPVLSSTVHSDVGGNQGWTAAELASGRNLIQMHLDITRQQASATTSHPGPNTAIVLEGGGQEAPDKADASTQEHPGQGTTFNLHTGIKFDQQSERSPGSADQGKTKTCVLSQPLQTHIAEFVRTKNKNKRVAWQAEDKKLALQVLVECGNNMSLCIRTLHSLSPIFQTISHKMLRTWKVVAASATGFGKRGRKPPKEFETELLSHLGFADAAKGEGAKGIGVNHVDNDINLTYNLVIRAAEELRATNHWISNEHVQNLKLSHHWVQNFLDRFNLRGKKPVKKAVVTTKV